MTKVSVRLVNASNRVPIGGGKFLTGYDVHQVELTDTVKACIQQNLLEKVPGAPVIEEPTEAIVEEAKSSPPPKQENKK